MNKIDCRIRNLEEGDIEEIAKLYSLFWNDKMNPSKMKEKFTQISENPSYIFLVAEKGGKIIAAN